MMVPPTHFINSDTELGTPIISIIKFIAIIIKNAHKHLAIKLKHSVIKLNTLPKKCYICYLFRYLSSFISTR